MIKSEFINIILDLLLDGDKFGIEVKPQKDFLTVKEAEYTGVGVFMYFNHLKGVEEYKTTNNNLILNGVTIKSPELKIGAEASLFFKDGLINYLEIWSYDGEYPEKELSEYTLKQEWKEATSKEIDTNNVNHEK